jgi:N-acetylglucosaminyldiphosphoundecaprenol N-acetyl-beta-D-mannosaminyltransferase
VDSASAGRADVLGMPVDLLSASGVHRAIEWALADPWDGRCRHVVTLNPEYVMAARRDAAFAAGIRAADLVTADGIGVAVAIRFDRRAKASDVGRVTGVELVDWLSAMSGPLDAPLFLLGAGAGVAAEAATVLRERHSGADFAGVWGGGTPALNHDREAISRIATSRARVVAVAYGAPGQVLWIERNRDALAGAGVRLAIGVGGALDFVAGRVPRAPAPVQRLGLEWLYRLIREPWRWRRQAVLPVFAMLVLSEQVRRRLARLRS